VPRELKTKQRCRLLLCFSRRDEGTFSFGGGNFGRTNGSNIGEPIRTRKGKLAGTGKHNAQLGGVVQVGKRGKGHPLI